MNSDFEYEGPDFVGEGRQHLVTGLVAIYDRVRASSVPAWVALEAPSGWGKTRIVREFYARLAAERQTVPKYWPKSIHISNPNAHALTALEDHRKQVNPSNFIRVALSRPKFMWWGISCASSNGTPSETLSRDFGIFEQHAEFLEDEWFRHASLSEKFIRPAVKGLRDKVAEDGADAALEAAAIAVAKNVGWLFESTIPGYSVGKFAIGKVAGTVRSTAARRSRFQSAGDIGNADDLVEEIQGKLTKLAIPELPVVLFVEDVHDADPMLLELLTNLVSQHVPIMIITTGWPGYSQKNENLVAAFRIAGSRLVPIDETSVPPTPFSSRASLRQLDRGDMSTLFDAYYPISHVSTKNALLDKYKVPLHLELALLTFQGAFADGATFELEPGEIAALPSKLRGLYEKLWTQLDPGTQKLLMFATLGIPAAVMHDAGASDAWDQQMLDAALRSTDQRVSTANALSLDRSWVKSIEGTLRQFQMPEQRDIAEKDDSVRAPVKRAVRDALIAEANLILARETDGSDSKKYEKTHAARLLIAYGPEHSDDNLISATAHLMDFLSSLPREAAEVVRLGRTLLPFLDYADVGHREILEDYALALNKGGDIEGALVVFHALLRAQREGLTPYESEVVDSRTWIAHLTNEAGHHRSAVQMYEDLLHDLAPAGTRDDRRLMSILEQYARALNDSGSPRKAKNVLLDVVARLEDLGAGQESSTWHTRLSLGHALSKSGDATGAILVY